MTFEIFDETRGTNGEYVDITPYIKTKGLKWQRADVEGEEATRNLDGSLTRDRKAIKTRWDVTCRPLTGDEAQLILKLIRPQSVMVHCDDPMWGTIFQEYYSNNIPASYLMRKNNTDYWDGITFPLIEM